MEGGGTGEGFITRDQLPEIQYAKSRRISPIGVPPSALRNGCSWRRQQGPTGSRENQIRRSRDLLGYHQISRGPNKGKESDRPITRDSLYGVNKGKGTKQSPRASSSKYIGGCCTWQRGFGERNPHRFSSQDEMGHISENKTLSKEDQQNWCLVDVPGENTKTGRWYQLSAPIARHLERLRELTHPRANKTFFRNQGTGKSLSDRIWRDSLQEMLVESGLATWAEGDSNDLRKTDITSERT